MTSGPEHYAEDIEFPIGSYRVLQLLGRGGIGEVYVAQRRGSSELCALKTLRPELKSKTAALARIRREAHVATLLNHPNICAVLDAGFEGETFFMATEFVPGVDLERLIRALSERGLALAPDVVAELVVQALDGLAHAHEAVGPDGRHLHLVHRDLSPRNIMVTFDGQVKIIDFGVAHARVDDYRTAPGVLVGTVKYLSPEQAMGTPVDARSDLYSLGAVMYEMLAGRSAVVGGQALIDALHEIMSVDPRPISKFNPSLPEPVGAVVNRALAKSLDARFASAAQMAAAVRAAAPPAGKAAVARLVRELFGDVAARMDALHRRAQDPLTSSDPGLGPVDPYSATAIAQTPNEGLVPTRTGRPDELSSERTETGFLVELASEDTRAVLPSRQPGGLRAPSLPGRTPVTGTTRVATISPVPSSTPAPAPASGRRTAMILAGVGLLVSAGLLAVTLAPGPAPSARIVTAPSAPSASPRVEARPQVSVAPRAAPAARRAPPAPPPPTPVAPPVTAPRERSAAPPAKTTTPRRRRRPRDPADRALANMARKLETEETLDVVALTALLTRVQTRADATGDPEAVRLARKAVDCLATCPTQERMLASARRALQVVRSKESAGAP